MELQKPWVSFCISTYKRPHILHNQLISLSAQTFKGFEVVVSDNDPEASAKTIVEQIDDSRFRYFHNVENLGMIKSFNKSIERANTEFIVMVTDDDPVEKTFLETFYNIYQKNTGYSIYCGFLRNNKPPDNIEVVAAKNFISEILDPKKTYNLLWSSAIIRRSDALKINCIPDYGSPHLADHAFLALAGSINGGVVVNKMFSTLSSHDSNFSKFNFNYYVNGCSGFYNLMQLHLGLTDNKNENERAILKHLRAWFISNIFSLKKYYSVRNPNNEMIKHVEDCATQILQFQFMKQIKLKYLIKNIAFHLKKQFWLLK